jgi:hypothetical protein
VSRIAKESPRISKIRADNHVRRVTRGRPLVRSRDSDLTTPPLLISVIPPVETGRKLREISNV